MFSRTTGEKLKGEDGWWIERVIWLVSTAAAATMSDATRLRVLRRLAGTVRAGEIESLGWSCRAGIQWRRRVAEDQAGSKRGQRWSRDEDRSMKRLWFQRYAGDSSWSWRWDGNFGLGFIRLGVTLWFSGRSRKIRVHRLNLDSTQRQEVTVGVRVWVWVLDFADGSMGFKDQLKLLFLLLKLIDFLLQTWFFIL